MPIIDTDRNGLSFSAIAGLLSLVAAAAYGVATFATKLEVANAIEKHENTVHARTREITDRLSDESLTCQYEVQSLKKDVKRLEDFVKDSSQAPNTRAIRQAAQRVLDESPDAYAK